MSLINSTSIDEAAKQQAIQDMIRLTEISEKENAAETLLMAKGFSDPVVSITDDKVDVVIHASSITDPERAQIEDIVKRKAEVGADQIIIIPVKYGRLKRTIHILREFGIIMSNSFMITQSRR